MNEKIYIAAGILAVALVIGGGWWLQSTSTQDGRVLAEENCADCHDLTQTRSDEDAPHLWGVINRRAGSVAGYEYSAAFRQFADARKFSWTETNIDLLIAAPDQLIPGTEMAQKNSQHAKAFHGVKDIDQRNALIAYLRTLKP